MGYPYEEVELEGKTYQLRLTLRGVDKVETERGNFLGRLGDQDFAFSTYISVVEASLYDAHKTRASRQIAADIVESVADKDGMEGVGRLVNKLLENFPPFKRQMREEGNSREIEEQSSEENTGLNS